MGSESSKESKEAIKKKVKETREELGRRLLELREKCCICEDRPIKMINLPCMHCCFCEVDGPKFHNDRCPICRVEKIEVREIYFC